ncbi:phage integrase family protein [Vibrio sp. ES.051]|uniref:tyrosine-type recombinase/integrase n=1 Tax=Vibrio sp. ES.051 TaxID=1761909 RepID=UPI000BF43D52|nr:tyrosine-type recombinase/integrase [Vibrio sp. ES.051]PFG45462.1 phage integrase family protein [Vibrio sp. ES.051]
MSEIIQTLTESVRDHFAQSGQTCCAQGDLLWVLERWPIADHKTRSLCKADIEPIEKQISVVPTGKQKHYKQALKDILFYLQDACHWVLPEARQPSIQDTDYEWFASIASEAQQAKQIYTCYQQQKTQYLTRRDDLSAAFIALMIGFEIAPLSLYHLSQLLSDPTSITMDHAMPRLRVHHRSSDKEAPYSTHYHLPLMSYRLLSDYYARSPEPQSEHHLHQQLTRWLQSHALPTTDRFKWSRRFQISWYVRHRLPPVFIRDLAIPERHVSLITEHQTSPLKDADIYAIDWDINWFERLNSSSRKVRWPHNALIKAYSPSKPMSTPIPPAPVRDVNNLLPRLLYDYTLQLITSGGVKKTRLAASTITKYTGLASHLEAYPLSYSDAINEEAINVWAQTVYDSLTTESSQHLFLYFLRFLSIQEQTDSIDLTRFSSPITPPSVSPARLTLAQLDTLIQTLIATNTTHPFRSLFAVMATLLGFFSMLRRGEVLRLRCQDVQFVPKTGLLSLTITNTEEGRTKSGRSRTVSIILPERYRPLFRVLLTIKKGASPASPLLGFEGEKYHSRQLYYFVPITRALKRHFGTHMKFHHLRHSGVHLLMLQVLHFVSRTPAQARGDTLLEKEVMSDSVIAARFENWLEGRDIREVNDGLVLDKVCEQIGHTHYATTRWSYLHDIDWLLPILSQAHQPHIARDYTHSELRYLMGLSPQSNDLSRRLIRLSPHYAQKTLDEKRSQTIALTDAELRVAMFGTPPATEEVPPRDHFRDWQRSIHTSDNTLLGFLFKTMMVNQSLDLAALSQIWSQGCQHDIQPIDKKSRTAFRQLPPIELSGDGRALHMTMACNLKNARAFAAAFRHKEWRWLTCHFELAVNRKLNPTRQIALLEQHYVQGKETVRVNRHPLGQTSLTIILTPKLPVSKPALTFTQQFIESMSLQKVTP